MFVKQAITLVCAVALVSCLEPFDDTSPYFEQYKTIIRNYGDLSKCNQTQCGPPCPGGEPLPYCPKIISNCLSGCACLLDCEHAVTTCFETYICLGTLFPTRKIGNIPLNQM